MKPELVCKIQVQTDEGKTCRGTGYPIARNRIITAAHVVADAKSEGDARDIKLFFQAREKPINGPVYIEWSGTEKGVDVAVLRCELPSELQPAHKLLTTPPDIP